MKLTKPQARAMSQTDIIANQQSRLREIRKAEYRSRYLQYGDRRQSPIHIRPQTMWFDAFLVTLGLFVAFYAYALFFVL